jgi:Bacterial extracellular solute-binding proteins, family 3
MVIVAAATTAVVALAGCGSSGSARTTSSPTALRFAPRVAQQLSVALELDSRPFVVAKRLDQVEVTPSDAPGPGYDVEMMIEVATRFGLSLTISDSEPGSAADCDCDVLLSASHGGHNGGRHTAPYFRDRQAVLIQKDTNLADRPLNALRLGAVTGSASLQFVRSVVRPRTSPTSAESLDALIAALRRAEFDAAVTDLDSALSQVDAPDSNLAATGQYTGAEYRVATVFGGAANRAALSQMIEQLTLEGFFDQLRAKYFPSTVALPLLTLTK